MSISKKITCKKIKIHSWGKLLALLAGFFCHFVKIHHGFFTPTIKIHIIYTLRYLSKKYARWTISEQFSTLLKNFHVINEKIHPVFLIDHSRWLDTWEYCSPDLKMNSEIGRKYIKNRKNNLIGSKSMKICIIRF